MKTLNVRCSENDFKDTFIKVGLVDSSLPIEKVITYLTKWFDYKSNLEIEETECEIFITINLI